MLGLVGGHLDSGPALAFLSSSKWGAAQSSPNAQCACSGQDPTPLPQSLGHLHLREGGSQTQAPRLCQHSQGNPAHPLSTPSPLPRSTGPAGKEGAGLAGRRWLLSPSQAQATFPTSQDLPPRKQAQHPPPPILLAPGWPLQLDGTIPPPSLARGLQAAVSVTRTPLRQAQTSRTPQACAAFSPRLHCHPRPCTHSGRMILNGSFL